MDDATPTDRTARLDELLALIDAAAPSIPFPPLTRTLDDLCALVAVSVGAPACSVARFDSTDDHLEYIASHGPGAEQLVGTRLPITRGLAGFVVQSGQSVAIDDVRSDPRFARDVAERTGYVPTSVLAVPIRSTGNLDMPAGVLSVLDRSADSSTSLAVAQRGAATASHLLARWAMLADLRQLVRAALAGDAPIDLVSTLSTVGMDESLRELLISVQRLRSLGPGEAALAQSVLAAVASFASAQQGRRRR
jgi:signal transduction protein with GAF and PtsI domain